jgi:uncharacterized protein YukE
MHLIKANFGDMDTMSGDMGNSVKFIESQVELLIQTSAQAHQTWTDNAGAEHGGTVQVLSGKMRGESQQLQTLALAVERAREDMQSTVSQVQQTMM